MAHLAVPIHRVAPVPTPSPPSAPPQQEQNPNMPPHIWHSSSPNNSSPDNPDPLPSPPPTSSPQVWAPADLPSYNLPSSSLPNLPAIPNIHHHPTEPTTAAPTSTPTTTTTITTSTADTHTSPEPDLLQRFFSLRLNENQPQTHTHHHHHHHQHQSSQDLLQRSASLHHNTFRPPSQHHPHHTPSTTRIPSPSPHDLNLDIALPQHYLTSHSGLLPLQAQSKQNHSLYQQHLSTSTAQDLNPVPLSSPILRPSSVPATSAAIPPPLAMGALPPPTQSGPRIKNELYKTEICRSYAESGGYCKYGAKCQFAHGDLELRPVRRHPRYKTKLCRNFVTTGTCPYDARCRFIHASVLPFTQPIQHAHPNHAGNPASATSITHHAQVRPDHRMMPTDAPHAVNRQDDYAEKLRFLETSLNTAATQLDHYVEAMNADQRSALSPHTNLQSERPLHNTIPASQVDYPTANVFHDYHDNIAFRNTIMQLSGAADSDMRFPSTDLSDRDPIHTTTRHGSKQTNAPVGETDSIIGSRFASTSDPQHESLFSNPGTNNSAVSPPIPGSKGTIGSRLNKGSEFVEGNTHAAPASSPTSRSRLPVFRNMAADDNAL